MSQQARNRTGPVDCALFSAGVISSRRSRAAASACLGALWLGLSVSPAAATGTKRVIFVANNKQSSWGEGYYRQNPQPKDQFVREAAGGNLSDAWGKLANGDTLIIIAHGTTGGGAIELKDTVRDGFKVQGGTGTGTGAGCGSAFPLPKRSLNNIHVELKVCYSDTDPTGAPTSVTSTILPLVNGTGNTATGKDGAVSIGYSPNYKDGTAEQKAETLKCLADAAQAAGFSGSNRVNAWLKSMSYPDQQAAVNAAIQACLNAGKDVVGLNITYNQPTFLARYEPLPADSLVIGGDPIDELTSILEAPCNVGCSTSQAPMVSEWGLLVLALLIGIPAALAKRRRALG